MVSEMMPMANRGSYVALALVIGNLALFIASILGLWLIPTLGWQSMFVLVGVGSIIVFVARKTLPESAAMVGK